MNLTYQPPIISGKKQEDYAKALEDYLALNKEDVEYWFNQIEKSTENIIQEAGNGNLFKLPVATKETLGGTMPQDDFTLDEYGKMSINLALLKSKLGMTQTTTNFVVLDGRDLQETDLTGLNTVFFRVTKSTPVITSTRTNTSAFSIEKMWFEDAGGAVVEVLPTSFTMESTKSVMVGTSATIGTTILPVNCNRKALTWSAENSNVSVYNGTVTGVRIGTCRVSARTINNLVASCLVTVTDNPNIYLYSYGNENVPITGGWMLCDTARLYVWSNYKKGQKTGTSLRPQVDTNVGIASGFRTINSIDLTNVKEIRYKLNKISGHETGISFSENIDGQNPIYAKGYGLGVPGEQEPGIKEGVFSVNSTKKVYAFVYAAQQEYMTSVGELLEVYLVPKQKLYLFNNGDECTSITGGWMSVDTSTIGVWPNQKNTQKNSDHLLAIAQAASTSDAKASGFRSVRKINLSNYSKMVVTFYKEGHESDIYFSAFEDGRQPWTGWVYQTGSTTGGMFTKEIALNSTSEMYIFFDAADAKYKKTTAKLYEIYLEQKQG